jgi:hypothetical protein
MNPNTTGSLIIVFILLTSFALLVVPAGHGRTTAYAFGNRGLFPTLQRFPSTPLLSFITQPLTHPEKM